jgi:hypothetical protein
MNCGLRRLLKKPTLGCLNVIFKRLSKITDQTRENAREGG